MKSAPNQHFDITKVSEPTPRRLDLRIVIYPNTELGKRLAAYAAMQSVAATNAALIRSLVGPGLDVAFRRAKPLSRMKAK